MKTLLVLAPHPDLAETVRSAIDPERYRVLFRSSLEEAEPLLGTLTDACIVDLDLTNAQAIWSLEKLRRRAPKIPILVVAAAKDPQWEEEAYAKGAGQVLQKPVRPRLLTTILQRLFERGEEPSPLKNYPQPTPPAQAASDTTLMSTGTAPVAPSQFLPLLRNFSGILIHSLNAEGMLKQFLIFLRDLLSINRGVVFLSPPPHPGADSLSGETRRFRACASLGIRTDLLQHFELSLEDGIGGRVSRLGRIVRRTAEESRQSPALDKEFELLGGQVAVPVFDRETVIGVAVFDGRITGEALTNSDLELIFHLLEPLGLAVKNIWLHDQVAANHQMMAGILRELTSACLVVGRDLVLLHANKTARKHFCRGEPRSGELGFSDLPEAVGTRIYQVLKTGSAAPTFRYSPENAPDILYSVNIVPFQTQPGTAPASALLIAENITQSEQLRRLEVEAGNLRLLRRMAEQLAHDINNATVPLSTHLQLFKERWKDAEFRELLSRAFDTGVNRVARLGAQMRYLARESLGNRDALPLVGLIDEAFVEAAKHQPAKPLPLEYRKADKTVVLSGDRDALKHAFGELLLNALQANPEKPKVAIRIELLNEDHGHHMVQVEIEDNGTGFSKEFLENGPSPFFGTRTVGPGLGLVVAQRIFQMHGGKLEIVRREPGQPGMVRITLPLGEV